MIAPRLKDLGRWVSGGTPPRDNPGFWDGDVPWLSGKDFDRIRLRQPSAFITEAGARQHSRVVPGGSTVLVLVRGMALVHGLPVARLDFDAAINQDVRALLVDPRFDAGFVRYSMLASRHLIEAHIDRAAHGTAKVVESLYSVRVPAPPLELQRRIAAFLDVELDRIDAVARHATEVAESVALFGPNALGERVASYPQVRLSHLGLRVEQGWSPEAEDRPPGEDEPVVLKLSAVSTGVFRPKLVKALPDADPLRVRRYRVHAGDVLMVRASGSLRLLGASCHVPDEPDQPTLFPDIVYRLRGDGPLGGALLVALLSTPQGRDGVEMLKRGAANNKIRLEDVRHMPVPSPPAEDIPALAGMAQAWGQAIREAQIHAAELQDRLARYQESVIYEAVCGQTDITASDTEMQERLEVALRKDDEAEVA